MNRQELLRAVRERRGIWCGNCLMVRILPEMDLASHVEVMRSSQCRMCGEVDWIRLTVELVTSDPRFTS